MSYIMPCDGRTQEVETDNVVAQVGTKSAGDRFADFDGRKLDAALPECVAGKGRHSDGVRRSAVEETFDLPVADHAIEQTGPAGALARAEHGAYERKNAGGLDQQPRRFVRYALQVQFGQSSLEIVVHQSDRQVGRTLDDANAQR